MKTPIQIAEVLKKEVLEWQDRGEFQTDLVPCLIPIITAVQRDAREGMVPNSDVERLIDNMNSAAERRIAEAREGMMPVKDVLPLIDALSSHNTEPIEALRAKYPNLFPK